LRRKWETKESGAMVARLPNKKPMQQCRMGFSNRAAN